MKFYRGNDILLFQFVLKYAFAVAETAIFFCKGPERTSCDLKSAAPLKNIFQLNTISADVLYRRCAHRPGYKAQVLYTCVTTRYTKVHQVVPNLAATGLYMHIIMINAVFKAAYVHTDHHAVKVVQQQHIAAAA